MDRERRSPWLYALVHLLAPLLGSVSFHLALIALLALTTWSVLTRSPKRNSEVQVGIVGATAADAGDPFRWHDAPAALAAEGDADASAALDFSGAPELSGIGAPDLSATTRDESSGGFGVGEGGAAGVLGVGGGLSDGGGGEGLGAGLGGGESLGVAGVWNVSARGNRFAYVVDFSGSIIIAVDELRRELKRSVGALRGNQEFNVIVFYGTGGRSAVEFRTESFAPKLQRATAAAKRAFFSWIDKKKPRGSTAPLAAMKRALALEPDAVFFFSDGYFDDEVVEEIAAANRNAAQIHCLVFDELLLQDDSEMPRLTSGARRLKRIAEQSGGSLKVVTGADLRR
ncbi:MAG: hypothetical protein D6744_01510 [Planctomycetota bacterium]|nr:MAG: hypothetical protein D6744_01510 [Planctomycetota bacterium]